MTTEAMGPIEKVLHEARPDFSAADLARAIEHLLESSRPLGSAALTAADQDFWDRHAGIPADAGRAPRAHALAVAAAALHEAGSLGTEDVAVRLGLKPATIRHYALARKLYSFKEHGRMLFPEWQFGEGGRPLPDLADIVDALPRGSHPLTVQGFFTTPQPDLRLGGEPVTPRQWLDSGGAPDAVTDLASSVGRL